MALINCPECGREISNKAQACIHCGFPLHDNTQEYELSEGGEKFLNVQETIEKLVFEADTFHENNDDKKAFEKYEAAAKLGDGYSQTCAGYCYHEGIGVEKDLEKAAHWYLKAAEKNNALAYHYLAKMYEHGEWFSKDISKAAEYHLQASTAGEKLSSGWLGVRYFHGTTVPQNYELAAKYLNRAIEQGHSGGLLRLSLAQLYIEGKGVPVNYEKAEQLINQARKSNQPNAKEKSDELEWEILRRSHPLFSQLVAKIPNEPLKISKKPGIEKCHELFQEKLNKNAQIFCLLPVKIGTKAVEEDLKDMKNAVDNLCAIFQKTKSISVQEIACFWGAMLSASHYQRHRPKVFIDALRTQIIEAWRAECGVITGIKFKNALASAEKVIDEIVNREIQIGLNYGGEYYNSPYYNFTTEVADGTLHALIPDMYKRIKKGRPITSEQIKQELEVFYKENKGLAKYAKEAFISE